MRFPPDWKVLGMLPPSDFIESNISSYKPRMEEASEHDRNGFFHYWLKQELADDQLIKLARLAELDPDEGLKQDVLQRISEVRRRIKCLPGS